MDPIYDLSKFEWQSAITQESEMEREGIKLKGLTEGKEHLAILLICLLLTGIFTYPLVFHLHNGVVADYGDPLLNSWIISHDIRTIFSSPGNLFQGNIMYPSRDVITYSEHLTSLALVAAPVYWVSGNPILAYNFLLFFGFVFSAFGAYLLVRHLTASFWSGLVGGIFFGFVTYKFSQMTHLQICFSAFFPFTLLYLHKFLEGGRGRHLALFGLFLLAQMLASWHYLIYISLTVILVVVAQVLASWRRLGWDKLVKLALVGLVCLLVVMPFARPYARTHGRFSDFERPLEETLLYNARLGDFRNVLPENVVYGRIGFLFNPTYIGYERVLCTGVVILFLLLSLIFLRKSRVREFGNELNGSNQEEGEGGEEASGEIFLSATGKAEVLGYLLVLVFSFILMFGKKILGMENVFYKSLYHLGLLKFIRVPTRFFIPMSMAMAVLGGVGLARILKKMEGMRTGGKNWKAITGIAITLLLLLELFIFNLPVYPVPVGDEVPEVYRWLSRQGEVKVIELPAFPLGPVVAYDRDLAFNPIVPEDYARREGYIIYMSTYHWKKVLNGYSGYFPFTYRRMITEMQGFPCARSVNLLRGLDVDYVIWHWEWVASQDMESFRRQLLDSPSLILVEDFGDQWVMEVRERGETASPEDLEMELAAPRLVHEGKGFNLGVMVSNHSEKPFVCAEEDYQKAIITWCNSYGETWEEKLEFHPPFFVDVGETCSFSLVAGNVPPAGDYLLNLELEGVLGQRRFQVAVDVVEELWDSSDPGNLDTSLVVREREGRLVVRQHDGLYPFYLAVTNLGDTQWKAETGDPERKGQVRLAIRFEQDGQMTWEEQRCALPCDVSPGQTVMLPALIRVPAVAGRYHLFIGLADEGFGWFGQVVEVEMFVLKDPLGGSP